MPRRGLSPAALERVRTAVAPDARITKVRPLRGGLSCIVHAVRLATPSGRAGVVVRRYGAWSQEHDRDAWQREYRLLQVLKECGLPVPRPLLLETDTDGPFGAPTILMELVACRPELAPRDLNTYLRELAEALAAFHRLPAERFDFLPDQRLFLENVFRPEREPATEPLHKAVRQTARQLWPKTQSHRRALVHADYWPGNVVFRRGRLVSVVDWEISCVGDPTRDVAICRGDLSALFGIEAADRFRDAYVEAGGSVETLGFWDLVNLDTALPEMHEWATAYPRLGRTDMTPALAVERIRIFAQSILDATMGG